MSKIASVARAKLHRQTLAHSFNITVHANSRRQVADCKTLTVVLGFLLSYYKSYFTL